jgi:hypothetical protein
MKRDTSKMVLGFNALSGAKEITTGILSLFEYSIANQFAKNGRFNLQDAQWGYRKAWLDAM